MAPSNPIQVPADIAARYDQPGQFERFDEAFKKVIAIPAHETPQPEVKPKKRRRRPRKE